MNKFKIYKGAGLFFMALGIVMLFIIFHLGVLSFILGLITYIVFRKKAFYSCDYCDESLKGGKYVVDGYYDYLGIFKIHMVEFDTNVVCRECNKETIVKRKMRMNKFFSKKERWTTLQQKEFKKYLED